ncbi:hypothetical protein F5Y16DRAFT_403808 [Xylariaceae sp. FL0255]|nr:hypothetical protein F5Y16DRAFT_403808 [Xylariaceae sp. FL0255]
MVKLRNDSCSCILFDKGADVNSLGRESGNALQAALWRGYEKIVQMLLDQGVGIDLLGGESGTCVVDLVIVDDRE